MSNLKVANISRIIFLVGIFATTILLLNATLVSADSKNLSDKGKDFRNNIWYGAGSAALITIIAAFIGTRAYNKA